MRPKTMRLRIISATTGGNIFDGFVTSFYGDGDIYRYVHNGMTQTIPCVGVRIELEP